MTITNISIEWRGVNKLLIVSLLCLLFSLPAACASLSDKVIDPSDPRFERRQFRFEDYNSLNAFKAAMQTLLPLGISEADIDELLVTHGGSTKVDDGLPLHPGLRTVRYSKEDTSSTHVRCLFGVTAPLDKHQKLALPAFAGYECDGP
jgi:hypothetical protein